MRISKTSLVFGILASLLTLQTLSTFANAELSFLKEKLRHKHHLQTPALEHPFVLTNTQETIVSQISRVGLRYYNLTWFQCQVDAAANATIPTGTVRLQGLINVDKTVYRPNETIFVEVLVLNAQTKTPVALTAADQQN
jgi:hypothetical protein